MMQVLKKWQILITTNTDMPQAQMEFFISDNHYQNVLRQLTCISYPFEPSNILIREYTDDQKSNIKC